MLSIVDVGYSTTGGRRLQDGTTGPSVTIGMGAHAVVEVVSDRTEQG